MNEQKDQYMKRETSVKYVDKLLRMLWPAYLPPCPSVAGDGKWKYQCEKLLTSIRSSGECSQVILAAHAGGVRCKKQVHVDFSHADFSHVFIEPFLTTWSAVYDN